MIIHIVYGRYGTALEQPEVFKNKKEAELFIQSIIADDVRDNHGNDISSKIYDNDGAVIAWGKKHDYCDDMTYKSSYDWHEYGIETVEI